MNKSLNKIRCFCGFTLVELMIVVSVIGTLSGVGISLLNQGKQKNRAQDAVNLANLEKAVTAVESYFYNEGGKYPSSVPDETNTTLNNYIKTWPEGFIYKYDAGLNVYSIVVRRKSNTNYYKYISNCFRIMECVSSVSSTEDDLDIIGNITSCTPVASDEDYSCASTAPDTGAELPPVPPSPPTSPSTYANGESCTAGGQCTSGYCVDGVCCNTACTGSICQSCDINSSAGKGTCGYTVATADPDNECTPSGYNSCSGDNKIGSDGNCSGTGYSCKLDGVSYTCPTAGPCQTGGGCSAGACQAISNSPDTNWKDNLYNCPTDSRCVSGTCHSCSGIVASDGCSGCANQGGYACWFNGGSGDTCNTACSARGGCISAAWKDPTPCTVCKALNAGETRCVSSSQSASPYWRSSDGCHFQTVTQSCSATYGTYRQCVCKW